MVGEGTGGVEEVPTSYGGEEMLGSGWDLLARDKSVHATCELFLRGRK